MAFRPDTVYKVYNSSGIQTETKPNFYEALKACKDSESNMVIRDGGGNIVFTKNISSDDCHLYQFNYKEALASDLDYLTSELIPAEASDTLNDRKMWTWLNSFRYTKAIDKDCNIKYNRAQIHHTHRDMRITDVYKTQEAHSGAYYRVNTLTSNYGNDCAVYSAEISIDLSDVQLIKQPSESSLYCNPYAFIGMIGTGGRMAEFGIIFRYNGNHRFVSNCSGSQNVFCVYESYSFSASKVRIVMTYSDGTVTFRAYNADTGSELAYNGSLPFCHTETSFASCRAAYRSASFCPSDSSDSSKPIPRLNCSEIFKGVRIYNSKITTGTYTNSNWTYNHAINSYAVSHNDEFIEVSISPSLGETINISYKGRDTNDNLIIS